MNPEIIAAIIQGGCAIVATVIAAIVAARIGKKFSNIKQLEEKLKIAQKDIEFLLAVEEEHCNIHKEKSKNSNKNKIRNIVKKEKALKWSGRNTPGRLKNP